MLLRFLKCIHRDLLFVEVFFRGNGSKNPPNIDTSSHMGVY